MRNLYLIIATSVLLYPSTAANENLCPCKFDGNDLQNCRVYGQLGDDKLIPWYAASQDCLDAHNIKISAIPSYTLESMCNPPNANTFVNYLKFEVREDTFIIVSIILHFLYVYSFLLYIYSTYSQPLPLQV